MARGAKENWFFVGANPANPAKQLPISERDRAVHSYVLGSSGVGKSKMLLDWVLQDILAGRGCAVIDPKGDLVFDILAALAGIDEVWWPSLADRILLIDPADPASSATFNPLETPRGASASRHRQDVFSVFRRIWGLDDTRAPRMELVLRRTLQLLMDAGLTLVQMPQVLTDSSLRENLLRNSNDPTLRSFWLNQFPQAESAGFQWVSPVVTRIESFLDDPAIRALLGQPRDNLDFRHVIDTGRVLLVNLAKGRVGEETSHLLGGFIMAKLQLAAEGRQAVWPPERRRRFYIYVDEFQNYQTSSFEEMLAEARGYGVSLVMAHQNLAQLDIGLRQAILANAKIRACFRVSYEDAEIMAKEMFRIRGDRVKEKELVWIRLGKVPIPIGFNFRYHSPSEEGRQNREYLHYLKDRRFWLHLADSDALLELKTVDIPPVDRRVAESRIRRFKQLLSDKRLLMAPRTISPVCSSQTAVRLPALPELQGLYDWSPPRRRPPRLRP